MTVELPPVTVQGRTPPPDDVTLSINGVAWSGWTAVRITRGIERLPSDFEVQLTEFAPHQSAIDKDIEIVCGDSCQVKLGDDLVLTGYVDRVIRGYDAHHHTVTIAGRSKCADLVDCSAEWPGGQIMGASVLEIAERLAKPYSGGTIGVTCIGDPGPYIPKFNLMRGETPFEIIERLCRFAQLLAYDTPKGDLLLSRVSSERTASGFKEGVNVLRAQAGGRLDERFSLYECFTQSVDRLKDQGDGGDLVSTVIDQEVPRYRRQILISETSGGIGREIAELRAQWTCNRNKGRASEIRVTTDSWRDSDGVLFAPNKLALVDLPTLKVAPVSLTIGEVTYIRGSEGTICELTLMAPAAYDREPFNMLQLMPMAEAGQIFETLRAAGFYKR